MRVERPENASSAAALAFSAVRSDSVVGVASGGGKYGASFESRNEPIWASHDVPDGTTGARRRGAGREGWLGWA